MSSDNHDADEKSSAGDASAASTALEAQSDTPPLKRKPGQRGKLTRPSEVADILRWSAEGLTQQQIASRFFPPKSQGTISEILNKFGTDRTSEAKQYLRATALDMAANIHKNGRAADHVAVLRGLDVLEESRAQALQIYVGASQALIQLAPVSPAIEPTKSET